MSMLTIVPVVQEEDLYRERRQTDNTSKEQRNKPGKNIYMPNDKLKRSIVMTLGHGMA